jgi:sulfite exporter TauE/SafE
MVGVPLWIELLIGSLGLGMLHGVVPDEHTWPITFSYSVGSATGKGGLLSGTYFASAFTLQRAIMSQLVYLTVGSYLAFNNALNGPVYVVVGIAMALAGYLILYGKLPHWHPLMWISRQDKERHESEVRTGVKSTVPVHWAMIHGFIAGFGVDTGLFTTFVYLVAVPSMPSSFLGFAPGAAFGFGTLIALLMIGTVFGGVLQVARRWGAERIQLFGTRVGARSLLFGGLIFIVAGFVFNSGIAEILPFDFGNLIVALFMVAVIVPVMIWTWKEVSKVPRDQPAIDIQPPVRRDSPV